MLTSLHTLRKLISKIRKKRYTNIYLFNLDEYFDYKGKINIYVVVKKNERTMNAKSECDNTKIDIR